MNFPRESRRNGEENGVATMLSSLKTRLKFLSPVAPVLRYSRRARAEKERADERARAPAQLRVRSAHPQETASGCSKNKICYEHVMNICYEHVMNICYEHVMSHVEQVALLDYTFLLRKKASARCRIPFLLPSTTNVVKGNYGNLT